MRGLDARLNFPKRGNPMHTTTALILTDPLFVTCFIALVCAQGSKLLIYYLRDRKMQWNLVFSTGGMPSSHASVVSALAAAVFLWSDSISLFVVVLVFASVVVRDALGVRWLAGQQSIAINEIIKSLRDEKKINIKSVKELVGHTPLQVYAGCVLGIAVAAAIYGVSAWLA